MSWMQTYTGQAFEPLTPSTDQVVIEDIAHALALLCRFNGHCLVFYSVAEHSCRVHDYLVSQGHPKGVCFWGLMHDASEAYLGDMVRPLKRQDALAVYRQAEKRVMSVIQAKYGLTPQMPTAVKHADNVLLASEKVTIMTTPPKDWMPLPDPIFMGDVGWEWQSAKTEFLERFRLYQSS